MNFDAILVGGGLHNGLIGLALLHHRASVRLALVEREPRLGGEHCWSFFPGGLAPQTRAWLDPLVAHRWESYEVRFPRHHRVLAQPYATITDQRLDQVVTRAFDSAPDCRLFLGQPAARVERDRVVLADGRALSAPLVVDARGPELLEPPAGPGFQKFVGLKVRLERPGGLTRPIVMDATVEQIDGYRFVYVLPLAADRLLVEDTYFSASRTLDLEASRQRALAWLRAHDLAVAELEGEESGCLPMPWMAPAAPSEDGPLRAGYQGGWFHPATGYSLPLALRLAELLGRCAPGPPTHAQLLAVWNEVQGQARFGRLLNRMMFGMIRPASRWRLFERFYRLPEATIARFYSLELRWSDRARVLFDRPPFSPIFRLPGARDEGE
jgi:lycopene beta-cyclase